MTTPANAGRTVIVTVDDDPGVSRAVARDLRRRYGEEYRIVRPDGKQRLVRDRHHRHPRQGHDGRVDLDGLDH